MNLVPLGDRERSIATRKIEPLMPLVAGERVLHSEEYAAAGAGFCRTAATHEGRLCHISLIAPDQPAVRPRSPGVTPPGWRLYVAEPLHRVLTGVELFEILMLRPDPPHRARG